MQLPLSSLSSLTRLLPPTSLVGTIQEKHVANNKTVLTSKNLEVEEAVDDLGALVLGYPLRATVRRATLGAHSPRSRAHSPRHRAPGAQSPRRRADSAAAPISSSHSALLYCAHACPAPSKQPSALLYCAHASRAPSIRPSVRPSTSAQELVVDPAAIQSLSTHYAKLMYRAVLNCTQQSLAALRKRVGSRPVRRAALLGGAIPLDSQIYPPAPPR